MKTTQSPIVGLITVFILASASTLLNMILPFKEILKWLQIPGPAGGMMIFGGFVFTFWITLAYLLLQCRSFTGVSVAVLIPAFCMIFSPWYGVVDPPWFGLYGIAAFFVAGLVLELTYRWRRNYRALALGGGFSNLCCLILTWIAIGNHTSIWPPLEFAGFGLMLAFLSGGVGATIAILVIKKVREEA